MGQPQVREASTEELQEELVKSKKAYCKNCNRVNKKRTKRLILMEMEKRNLRKERVGVVTSNKMQKSIVVSEIKKVKHPMYGKFVLKTKKYVAHDETNDCNVGDTVRIMETRPMSKSKCWRLVEIIERAK